MKPVPCRLRRERLYPGKRDGYRAVCRRDRDFPLVAVEHELGLMRGQADRQHPSLPGCPCLQDATVIDHPNRVFDGDSRPGNVRGGNLADAVADDRIRLDAKGLPDRGQSHLQCENGRLCHLRFIDA